MRIKKLHMLFILPKIQIQLPMYILNGTLFYNVSMLNVFYE